MFTQVPRLLSGKLSCAVSAAQSSGSYRADQTVLLVGCLIVTAHLLLSCQQMDLVYNGESASNFAVRQWTMLADLSLVQAAVLCAFGAFCGLRVPVSTGTLCYC